MTMVISSSRLLPLHRWASGLWASPTAAEQTPVRNTFIHYNDRDEEDEQPDIEKFVSNLLDGVPSDWSKNERLSDHIEGIAQGYRIRRASSCSIKSQEFFVESPPASSCNSPCAAASKCDQSGSPEFTCSKAVSASEEELIEFPPVTPVASVASVIEFPPRSSSSLTEFPPRSSSLQPEFPPRSSPLQKQHAVVESPPVIPVTGSLKHNKIHPAGSINKEAMEPEVVKKNKGALPSLGSAAHGEGNCKPCAWHWKPGGCLKGNECSHCHICGKSVLKKKRKDRLARIKDRRRALAEANEADASKSVENGGVPEQEQDDECDDSDGSSRALT